jgi:DNA gyrase subunit A
MQTFSLDQVQVDAILELRLYQLARLEIARIQEERAEKRKRLGEVRRLLERPRERWKLIRSELIEIRDRYGDCPPHEGLRERPRGSRL